eukprot:TRINITY_DN112174_c0_g1_i1.p1 TRINITY_DN112174_c0_g1~~TRINITY_DN112174_c0_g1_i1.p1  ORF type:complete len:257 (+),score=50.13 TRINITY_DN112174_c0_g1_i1:54-773(+)
MGVTLSATQKLACGHTNLGHLRQSLLCDSLSQPTAEMVESLLALQGMTVQMEEFAKQHDAQGDRTDNVLWNSHALLLLATCYCTMFGYRCRLPGQRAGMGTVELGSEPTQPSDFLQAFQGALCRPQQLLQDLLALRAQVLPRDRLVRLQALLQDGVLETAAFPAPFRELLDQLTTFVRAAVQCAKIYAEISDCADAGQMDRHQAASMLEGQESDQKRMINAMGDDSSRYDEHDVENGHS